MASGYTVAVKRVAVLGSTGSIGAQTLDVASQFPDELEIVGLAARASSEKLRLQAQECGAKRLALFQEGSDPDIATGMNALLDLATAPEVDVVVVSVAGVIGLLPTLAAIKAGKRIALASKEVLVAAGEIVMPLVAEHGTTLTPIDSEHSAIFQCLQGYKQDQIDKLILTASGGPFFGRTKEFLEGVSVQDALNHPTWNMGGKITVDSATLMNKGLETIEAHWLFGVDIERIETVVHRQSVVHSMVKFKDGSVLGQLGWPNMRLPIAYALLFPERLPNQLKPWNPTDTPSLTFAEVDHDTFPSLRLAIGSAKTGGTAPCAMNAANEEAANAFLRGELPFLGISEVVEHVLSDHQVSPACLDSLMATDEESRAKARERIRATAT